MARITITQNYVGNLKSAIEDCHAKRSYTYYKCLIFEGKKYDSLKILKRLSDYIFYLGWLDVTIDSTVYVQCIKDIALDSCTINEEELLSASVIYPILFEDGLVVLTEQFSNYLEQESPI
jgi:hypothetical protein